MFWVMDYVIPRYPKGVAGYKDVGFLTAGWRDPGVHEDTNDGYKGVCSTGVK